MWRYFLTPSLLLPILYPCPCSFIISEHGLLDVQFYRLLLPQSTPSSSSSNQLLCFLFFFCCCIILVLIDQANLGSPNVLWRNTTTGRDSNEQRWLPNLDWNLPIICKTRVAASVDITLLLLVNPWWQSRFFPPFKWGNINTILYLIAVVLSSYKKCAYILMTLEKEVNLRKKHDRKPRRGVGCRMQNKTILIGKMVSLTAWSFRH